MKRFLSGALAVLLALFWVSCAAAELTEEQISAADSYFQRRFAQAKAVGGAVLVSRNGKRIYSFFYGAGDKKGTRPVDEDTVYKVASVSKMVSAIGAVQLAEAGLLDLDAPLTCASGRPIRNPWHPEADVTLRQAMSHTTSLLKTAPYTKTPDWDRIDLSDGKYFSKRVPGAHYEYANLNGGILCSAIERASGQSLNDYMAGHVFAPLGINAAYAAHLLPDPEPLSNTYMADGALYRKAENYLQEDEEEYENTCDPDQHYRSTIGGLYISLSGLEKLAQALACGGAAGGARLLSPQAAEMMRADQSTIPGSSVTGFSPYGLCVSRFEAEDGVTWYGHQGRWKGLQVDVFFEPASRATLVFVMNGVSRSGNKEVDAKAERAMLLVSGWLDAPEEPEIGAFVVEDEE